MQKILFVSIVLLIGLFSLQWSLHASGRNYYTTDPKPVFEVQPAKYEVPDWYEDYELRTDSLGKPYFVKREVQIRL